MFQAAGFEFIEEEIGGLGNIDNFSCEDLRIIDQLWLESSQGKFGFRVQKEIYESLGGTREYNDETWDNFGDRVGWKRGEWLYWSDLIFNLDEAPTAHLPVLWGVSEIEWFVEDPKNNSDISHTYLGVRKLFSLAKACNM